MKAKTLALSFLALALCVGVSTAQITVWDGTADKTWYTGPDAQSFSISTAEELAGLAELVNSGTSFSGQTIVLQSNILLNDTTGCGENGFVPSETSNKWIPIGTSSYPFMGEFDGTTASGSRKIFGLYVSSSSNYQGLFGYTSGVKFNNIALSCGAVTGKDYTGALVGYAISGSITNASSDIVVQGGSYVGGLVGYATGTISSSNATGDVTATARSSYAGGLVGYTTGAISSSNATGDVAATGDYVGGLVGYTTRSVSGSIVDGAYTTYSLGSVTGGSYVGGLVGYAYASSTTLLIDNAYSEGSVEATGRAVGGVVGYAEGYRVPSYNSSDYTFYGYKDRYPVLIRQVHSIGNIKADGNSVGGVLGEGIYAPILNSYSNGDVSGQDNVGGVAGQTTSSIGGSHSEGAITGSDYVGGIVGAMTS
jgi:hypothetical protein